MGSDDCAAATCAITSARPEKAATKAATKGLNAFTFPPEQRVPKTNLIGAARLNKS
jgi:hypothetical protein